MRFVYVLILCIALPSIVQASTFEYWFAGAINDGSRITWEATFDADIPDQDPSSDRAYFPGSIRGLSVSRGGPTEVFIMPENTPFTAITAIQTPQGNVYTLTAPAYQYFPGYPTAFSLTLNGPTAPLLTTPTLGSITSGVYRAYYADMMLPYAFQGGITEAVLTPVPLPPSLYLFGAGLLVLGYCMRVKPCGGLH